MRGKIAQYKINNGSDADMKYMLDMCNNLVHYVHFICIYAPCIVGHMQWNDKAKMLQYCGKGATLLFNEYILSISDEAFLLLVLYNYTSMWMSELQCEQAKVTQNKRAHIAVVDYVVLHTLFLHVWQYG
jgi:hypothetical protein